MPELTVAARGDISATPASLDVEADVADLATPCSSRRSRSRRRGRSGGGEGPRHAPGEEGREALGRPRADALRLDARPRGPRAERRRRPRPVHGRARHGRRDSRGRRRDRSAPARRLRRLGREGRGGRASVGDRRRRSPRAARAGPRTRRQAHDRRGGQRPPREPGARRNGPHRERPVSDGRLLLRRHRGRCSPDRLLGSSRACGPGWARARRSWRGPSGSQERRDPGFPASRSGAAHPGPRDPVDASDGWTPTWSPRAARTATRSAARSRLCAAPIRRTSS